MNRRTYLYALGTAGVTTLAGCTGSDTGSDTAGTDGSDGDGGDGGGDGGGGLGSGQKEVEIIEHEPYVDSYSAGVQGILQNTTDEVLEYVQVEVAFYDAADVKIGDGLDNTNDLRAGGKWQFDAMYLGQDTSQVDSYSISAEATNY